jgi:hypothetical protein
MGQLVALQKVDAIFELLNDCEPQRDSGFGITGLGYEAMAPEACVRVNPSGEAQLRVAGPAGEVNC